MQDFQHLLQSSFIADETHLFQSNYKIETQRFAKIFKSTIDDVEVLQTQICCTEMKVNSPLRKLHAVKYCWCLMQRKYDKLFEKAWQKKIYRKILLRFAVKSAM